MESAHSVPLDRLLAELRAARAAVASERGPGHRAREGSLAQSDLLVAIEAYVEALTSAGHPVPYRLRDELFMYRRISVSDGPWRG